MFGVASTMRPPELQGIDDAVGNFVTTQPARMQVDRAPTMSALIAERHEDALLARTHEAISLTRLQQLAGLPSGEAPFDTIISIEQDAMSGFGLEGKDALFTDLISKDRSNFPLAFFVRPGERMGLRLLFDTTVHDVSTARLILSMAETAFSALPGHLDRSP